MWKKVRNRYRFLIMKINLIKEDGRFVCERANLKLTRIPALLHPGYSYELGVLETPLGKAVVNIAEYNRSFGSQCSCGNFIIFTDGKRQTLSVPCKECTKGLRLAECEAFFGGLDIKPGDQSHTSVDFLAGYGDGIIRFYRGGIEEAVLDEGQVRDNLAKLAFDAQI